MEPMTWYTVNLTLIMIFDGLNGLLVV